MLPNERSLKKQITAYYYLATAKEFEDGTDWYCNAHYKCKLLADLYSVPLATVAGIVAALSPRNKWERNLIDAELVLLHGEEASVATFTSNRTKAVRILNGEPPLSVLSGNKVRSFYECILDPSVYIVCVDSHAYAIAVGNGERIKPKVITDAQYLAISQAYQAVAKELVLLPNQLQAITWLAYRRIHRIK
jgi:hypothetical protein